MINDVLFVQQYPEPNWPAKTIPGRVYPHATLCESRKGLKCTCTKGDDVMQNDALMQQNESRKDATGRDKSM